MKSREIWKNEKYISLKKGVVRQTLCVWVCSLIRKGRHFHWANFADSTTARLCVCACRFRECGIAVNAYYAEPNPLRRTGEEENFFFFPLLLYMCCSLFYVQLHCVVIDMLMPPSARWLCCTVSWKLEFVAWYVGCLLEVNKKFKFRLKKSKPLIIGSLLLFSECIHNEVERLLW